MGARTQQTKVLADYAMNVMVSISPCAREKKRGDCIELCTASDVSDDIMKPKFHNVYGQIPA
eukprot:12738876-Heterocapsa_arctica.AAC.1